MILILIILQCKNENLPTTLFIGSFIMHAAHLVLWKIFTTKPASNYLWTWFNWTWFFIAFNSISRFIRAKTGVVPFSESTTLITEGFYKYTRNPMYVGMNSFLLGLLIILNNQLIFIFLIIFFFIVRNLFVIKEEVQMEETFGEDYLTYKGKVRRWL